MVYQELSGIGQLSVAENLFLGRQPTTTFGRIDWRSMRRQAAEQLAELEIDVDVDRRLASCPLVVRQMVEIARGLHSGARVSDPRRADKRAEPTRDPTIVCLAQSARERDVALVFISHFIEDVLEICDRVTILRAGRS